jgi:23S rRNA (guanosine2251-2'-O)-methyltransferase
VSRYVFGKNSVKESLQLGIPKALRVYLKKGSKEAEEVSKEAARAKVPVETRDSAWFDKLAKGSTHQGIALEMPDFDYVDIEDLLERAPAHCLLVIADSIEDPRNLGALARSVEASGGIGLVIGQDRSVQITPLVEKTASGALAHLKVAKVVNISRALEQAKKAGFWVYGLAGQGTKSLFETKLDGKVCLVLGGEGEGIRDGVRKHCDELLRIPMPGKVESLNVAVAGAVACFEVLRQRQNPAVKK